MRSLPSPTLIPKCFDADGATNPGLRSDRRSHTTKQKQSSISQTSSVFSREQNQSLPIPTLWVESKKRNTSTDPLVEMSYMEMHIRSTPFLFLDQPSDSYHVLGEPCAGLGGGGTEGLAWTKRRRLSPMETGLDWWCKGVEGVYTCQTSPRARGH